MASGRAPVGLGRYVRVVVVTLRASNDPVMPNIRVTLDDLDDDSDGSEPTSEDYDLDAAYHAAVAKPSVTSAPAASYGLPSEVVVAGCAYPVEVYTTGGEPTNPHDRLYGSIHYDDGIRVNADGRDEFRDTLLHEVLHAVDHHAGANAGEVVVAAWTPVLLDVLRKNPGLVAFLLDQ